MPEKLGLGEYRGNAVIRTPALKFEIVRWDWNTGSARDANPIDITPAVFSFRWMKSLRNPESGCELSMISQFAGTHYLDSLNPMDVLKVYEFGTLKYLGFIRRIAGSGSISQAGTPNRSVSISCSSFGALFSEGQLGLNMFLKVGKERDFKASLELLQKDFKDLVVDGKSYAEMVGLAVDTWLKFIGNCGATKYEKYFSTWINYDAGLKGKAIPGVPMSWQLFYGTEQSITLWDVLHKLVQSPFNEVWFDCGPRNVWVENNKGLSGKPGEISLTDEKEHLIVRAPPFDGTVIDKAKNDLWESLPARTIPLSYLTRFDLNKSMDESASFYLVAPPIYNPGELALIAMGKFEMDTKAFNKYLYRPMVQDLYFSRILEPGDVATQGHEKEIYDDAQDKAATLKNWNEHNDEYLSGALTFMVPSDEKFDPRIGDRLEVEGITDASFYVEGVSHSWTYGGSLTSNVSVTRGWGLRGPIELKDKIFKRGIFSMGESFK